MNKHTWKGIAAFTVLILVISSIFAYAAIQSQVGINTQSTTGTWRPVKDAQYGTAITSVTGVPTFALYGSDVNTTTTVNRLTIDNESDAANESVNTTNKLYTYTKLFGVEPGAATRLSISADVGSPAGATANIQSLYVASYPLCQSGATTGTCVSSDMGLVPVTDPSQTMRNTNITTNTSTVITSSALKIGKLIINVAGTTSTAAFYADTSAPCDTGYLFTLPSTVTGTIITIDHISTGLCILTAGAAAANITTLNRY